MSAPGNRPPSRSGGGPARRTKGGVRPPNRAQIRAMEARAAVAPVETDDGAPPDREVEFEGDFAEESAQPTVVGALLPPRPRADARGRAGARGARPGDHRRTTARPAASRPAALSREEEYRHIRGDMNRLLVTAGGLLMLMLVLLIIFD